MSLSQNDINDFISDLGKTHPEYSISDFKINFKEAVSRDPSFDEIRTFQKIVKDSISSSNPASGSSNTEIFIPIDDTPTTTGADVIEPIVFLCKSSATVCNQISLEANRVDFSSARVSVGISLELLKGRIYVLDVIMKGKTMIGLAQKEFLPLQTKNPYFEKGTCTFCQDGAVSTQTSMQKNGAFWDSAQPTPVTLQLDMTLPSFTLHCLPAGKLVPHAVCDVPDSTFWVLAQSKHGSSSEVRYAQVVSLRMVRTSVLGSGPPGVGAGAGCKMYGFFKGAAHHHRH